MGGTATSSVSPLDAQRLKVIVSGQVRADPLFVIVRVLLRVLEAQRLKIMVSGQV